MYSVWDSCYGLCELCFDNKLAKGGYYWLSQESFQWHYWGLLGITGNPEGGNLKQGHVFC